MDLEYDNGHAIEPDARLSQRSRPTNNAREKAASEGNNAKEKQPRGLSRVRFEECCSELGVNYCSCRRILIISENELVYFFLLGYLLSERNSRLIETMQFDTRCRKARYHLANFHFTLFSVILIFLRLFVDKCVYSKS